MVSVDSRMKLLLGEIQYKNEFLHAVQNMYFEVICLVSPFINSTRTQKQTSLMIAFSQTLHF